MDRREPTKTEPLEHLLRLATDRPSDRSVGWFFCLKRMFVSLPVNCSPSWSATGRPTNRQPCELYEAGSSLNDMFVYFDDMPAGFSLSRLKPTNLFIHLSIGQLTDSKLTLPNLSTNQSINQSCIDQPSPLLLHETAVLAPLPTPPPAATTNWFGTMRVLLSAF